MVDNALLVEATVRGLAAGGFLACALIFAPWQQPVSRLFGSAAYLAKAAHTLAQFQPLVALMGAWYLTLDLPSIIGASLTWLFCIEFLDETPRFQWVKLVPAAVVLAIGVAAKVSPPDTARALWLANNFINVALMAHIVVIVLRTWRNDLVEPRRLAVAPLFLISAAYTVTVAFVQSVELFTFAARQPSILAAVVLMLSSWLGVAIFGSARAGLFRGAPKRPPVEVTAKPAASSAPALALAPADAAVLARLEELMRTEKLYRMENLKISTLALRLRMPEYKLRKLLNSDLGYRNFSAYISEWRLAEAKQALCDPSQAEVPISTIAIDSGFQSLAPFNRAFKAATGMTPTEYRGKGGGGRSASAPAERQGGGLTPALQI
jgi:AraC-like DNA-binding protein